MNAARSLRQFAVALSLLGMATVAIAQSTTAVSKRQEQARNDNAQQHRSKNYEDTIRAYQTGSSGSAYRASTRSDVPDIRDRYARNDVKNGKKGQKEKKPPKKRNGSSGGPVNGSSGGPVNGSSGPVTVSEPATGWLLGMGLALLGLVAWRKRRA